MPDPIRDLLDRHTQPPAQDLPAVAATVVGRGRRRVRRRRAVTAGSLVVLLMLTGIAAAGAIRSGGHTKITTGGTPATSSTTAPPSAPSGRSIGLTDAQQRRLFADHMDSVETCMRSKGIEFSIEIQDPGGAGRVHYGDHDMPTPEEQTAMIACTDAASAAETTERDRLLREAGNPVVTLDLAACPALEDVVLHGDLPDRFDTDGVNGKAGGIPLNMCFGSITTTAGPPGKITVSEGIAEDRAAATTDAGTYFLGPTANGFLAVYKSDQLPSHYIEASGVSAAEFDILIASLQPR